MNIYIDTLHTEIQTQILAKGPCLRKLMCFAFSYAELFPFTVTEPQCCCCTVLVPNWLNFSQVRIPLKSTSFFKYATWQACRSLFLESIPFMNKKGPPSCKMSREVSESSESSLSAILPHRDYGFKTETGNNKREDHSSHLMRSSRTDASKKERA